ncbi:DUF4623 domain-containing protein [Sphingobacterium sp. SGR-19]|uniref:DUF4623 domain-containing protein n=1 Tax=Sphingobacterium sp. SGR-19 TaxID=2710886 RepID=UPI0013EAA169|nr:DUF4623 domain-containing protein [Sphingobacterium sp. SGR-19]NGM65940.1 DUF4623 domain-containing protein [Sphingobacterium sp. SGR-19]
MKRTDIWSKGGLLILFVCLLGMTACEDDLPGAIDSSANYTVLESVRIINTGENGDVVVEGMVDEETKRVSFPRIDTLTNFENLTFEVEVSDGARLEKEIFDVKFEEGESETTIVLKVVHEPRFREYLATLRLKVPVYGADFTKPAVYDYSANEMGNPTYEAFTGMVTRGTGFDGEHVLIVSRGGTGVHLLDVDDLKNNTINRIPVNTAGMNAGTFLWNMGAQVNGHTYVVNLSTSAAQPVRLYHWTNPSQEPEVIANILPSNLSGAGARHGDNFSISLDDQGNGYAYWISMGTEVIRIQIQNYTDVVDQRVINTAVAYGQWSSYLQAANSEFSLVTGLDKPIAVVNSSGSVSYTMPAAALPTNATDARVIDFNGERYLLVVTVPRTGDQVGMLQVYNITVGRDIVAALTSFSQRTNKEPVYQYLINGVTNIAPASQTGFHIVKDGEGNDEKLMLYGAVTDGGFAIIEFPVNIEED